MRKEAAESRDFCQLSKRSRADWLRLASFDSASACCARAAYRVLPPRKSGKLKFAPKVFCSTSSLIGPFGYCCRRLASTLKLGQWPPCRLLALKREASASSEREAKEGCFGSNGKAPACSIRASDSWSGSSARMTLA